MLINQLNSDQDDDGDDQDDDNKINDKSDTKYPFNWRILSKSISNFDNGNVLQLAIGYGLAPMEVVILHEVDIMRMLEGGKQENIYEQIQYCKNGKNADIDKLWSFCVGLIQRYNSYISH